LVPDGTTTRVLTHTPTAEPRAGTRDLAPIRGADAPKGIDMPNDAQQPQDPSKPAAPRRVSISAPQRPGIYASLAETGLRIGSPESDADAVTKGLAEIQTSLRSRPMKFPWYEPIAGVADGSLGFDRYAGEWALVADLSDDSARGAEPVEGLSLDLKAHVAKAMPLFLNSYLAEAKRREKTLEEAAAAIRAAKRILEGE
jgi:hypothetical protein